MDKKNLLIWHWFSKGDGRAPEELVGKKIEQFRLSM